MGHILDMWEILAPRTSLVDKLEVCGGALQGIFA